MTVEGFLLISYVTIGLLWVTFNYRIYGPLKPVELVIANIAFWPIIMPLSFIAWVYDRRREQLLIDEDGDGEEKEN